MRRVEHVERVITAAADWFRHFNESVGVSTTTITTAEVDMEMVYRAALDAFVENARSANCTNFVADAAIAEYERQKGEGACRSSGLPQSRSQSSTHSDSGSDTGEGCSTNASAASEMTDEELWDVYKKAVDVFMPSVVPDKYPSLNHVRILRAVANAQRERVRVVVYGADLPLLFGSTSIEVLAERLRSIGVEVRP